MHRCKCQLALETQKKKKKKSQFWSRVLGLVSIPVGFWFEASKASVATYNQHEKFNISFLFSPLAPDNFGFKHNQLQ